jgi:flagella basal body P-ring formation protein FlgA
MAGARRVFAPDELAALARRHHLAQGAWREVCFEWPLHPLSPTELAAAMAAELGLNANAIEIVEIGAEFVPPGAFVLPRERLAALPGNGDRLSLWRGSVRYASDRSFPFWAKVRILAPVVRVVPAVALAAGQRIDERQLTTMIQADGVAAGVYAASMQEVAGHVPKSLLAPGVPIRLSDLTAPPEIAAGDRVEIEVRNGPLRIRSVAIAERAGRIGETIQFSTPGSPVRFRARVEGPLRASVTVEPAAAAQRSLGEDQ